jgi:hypothetical protein
MFDKFKIKLGPTQPGYRFKPGECVVNSNWAEEFRQGKCTQNEIDGVKLIVTEVGINKATELESYRLLYNSPPQGGEHFPGQEMDQWFLKAYVESNFEICEYPVI